MKRLFTVCVVLLMVAAAPAAADDNFFAYDLTFRDVEMRQGVTADMHVLVLKNTNRRSSSGKTDMPQIISKNLIPVCLDSV